VMRRLVPSDALEGGGVIAWTLPDVHYIDVQLPLMMS
jgi:hypothetical protein